MSARKTVHAVAAILVLAVASLVWTAPAQAAPAGPCAVEEWKNPKNFADCARRMGDAAAAKSGCVAAPTPDSPTSGMSGMYTRQPESAKRDGIAGLYSMYGVGGYGLDTYDLGCLGTVKHPNLTFWNTFADGEFVFAKTAIGAANGLRERAYDPAQMWGWADGFLTSATSAVYDHVFTVVGALTLALIGAFLLWRARHGNMSQAMRMTAWALFVMVAVTGIAKWPLQAAHGADTVSTTGLNLIHSVLGPSPTDIADEDCVLGGDSCKDNRTVAVRSSDAATEAVLYRTWVSALLGDADSPTAQKYGRALYDATSMTWGEAERAAQSPQLRQQLIDRKAQTWNTIAEQVRAEDPLAYEHLQGIHGQDRAGAGVLAVLSALAFAAFDMAASIVILFGFGIFRIAIILLPLLGTIGMFAPASAGVRRAFHATTAAAVNIVIFGGAAGFYLTAVTLIYSSPVPYGFQIFLISFIGVGLIALLHPVRQLYHTATGRSRAKDGMTSRLFRAGRQLREEHRAATVEVIAADPTPSGTVQQRPETTSQPRRATQARIVLDAVAPTFGEAASHPLITAATGAAQRPETSATPATRARSVLGALARTAANNATSDPAPTTENRN